MLIEIFSLWVGFGWVGLGGGGVGFGCWECWVGLVVVGVGWVGWRWWWWCFYFVDTVLFCRTVFVGRWVAMVLTSSSCNLGINYLIANKYQFANKFYIYNTVYQIHYNLLTFFQ